MGVTTSYIYVLATISGGTFLISHPIDSFNAPVNLVGSLAITLNEMTLTLEHVMRKLEVIENKMSTVEHIEKSWQEGS